MDVLRPLSTGVSTSRGPCGTRARRRNRGTLLRAMHQHPGSIPLYLIKTTNTPSTLNQHPFVPIETRVSIRIVGAKNTRQWRDLFRGGSFRVGGESKGKGSGRRNSRCCEMLLMLRGQRDKHARETSSCRFVPVFVSSLALSRPDSLRTQRDETTKDVDSWKAHAAI